MSSVGFSLQFYLCAVQVSQPIRVILIVAVTVVDTLLVLLTVLLVLLIETAMRGLACLWQFGMQWKD